MEIRQLKHFVAAVEYGNLLQASTALHITQPALSKSIRILEERLGVKLLERTPRGVTPTLYGLQLLDHAKLILTKTQQAEEGIRAMAEGETGHISVGFGANFAGLMFPQAILNVIDARPGVTATVLSKPYDELLPRLRQGDIDLAIVAFPPEPNEPDLVYEPLIESEFQTVCRPSHPLVGQGKISVEELAQQDWILFNGPKTTATIFNYSFLEVDVVPPKPVIQTSSVFFLKSALKITDLLSSVPMGLVHDEQANSSFAVLETNLPIVNITTGIIYRADDILPTVVEDVIAALRFNLDNYYKRHKKKLQKA